MKQRISACFLILLLTLFTGCASSPKPQAGLYKLVSLGQSGLSVDTVVTLDLQEDYLLVAGPNSTWSAPIKKDIVGAFTLRNGSSAPGVYTRMFLGILKDSEIESTPTGALLFKRNDKIVASFVPVVS